MRHEHLQRVRQGAHAPHLLKHVFGSVEEREVGWLCEVIHAGETMLTVREARVLREATWQIEPTALQLLGQPVLVLPRLQKLLVSDGQEMKIRGPVRCCRICKRDLIGEDCARNISADGWVFSDTPYPDRFWWKEQHRMPG